MCHPPCTKFEMTPKLGECAKWCCLRCLEETQIAKPGLSEREELEAPPPMLADKALFPPKKEALLTELLQEYLSR